MRVDRRRRQRRSGTVPAAARTGRPRPLFRWFAGVTAALGLLLAACNNGTAVVTLTGTPSPANFLAYKISIASLDLQGSDGTTTLQVLPAAVTVDLASLANLTEVVGATSVTKGKFTGAVATLDFGNAQIVYDDGSSAGVVLSPVDASGKALTEVKVTVTLDPGSPLDVAARSSAQLALELDMALSNAVDLAAKTVTVTPVLAGSGTAIDTKQARIRGQLTGVTSTTDSTVLDTATAGTTLVDTGAFTLRVAPFNGTAVTGSLTVATTDSTGYEINGAVAAGGSGLSGLPTGSMTVAYGTLALTNQTSSTDLDGNVTTTTNATTGIVSTTSVTFTATQVLSGTSVQGQLDRISGTVSARSGDTLALQAVTLLAADGTESFFPGTALVVVGGGTTVTSLGQSATEFGTIQGISIGSVVDVFGIVTQQTSSDLTLDASAGHVRIDPGTALGTVTALADGSSGASGVVDLSLAYLGGRSVAGLDFVGSDAAPSSYQVDTGTLDLTNAATGVPLTVTGVTNAFGVSPPNFIASSLLDPTTLVTQLTIDWGAGTTTPFKTIDSTEIDIDAKNPSIGTRHQISYGAQTVDIAGLSTDPIVEPDTTASTVLFSIAHASTGTVESFNTYDTFATRLQAELSSGKALGMTAQGLYTVASYELTATQITVLLAD